MNLKNRKVLITGATGGIGSCLIEKFYRLETKIIATGTNEEKLNNLKIGQHTKPIILPGGFVILKIEDIKESDLKINFDEEVKKLIRYKTTQQYDQFSNIYFKRVEKDLIINEL